MPESPIRRLFDEAPSASIDVAVVVRRSRARRVPKAIGAGAVAVLAIGGIGFIGLQGLGPHATGASDTAGSSLENAPMFSQGGDAATDSGIKRAPAEKINLCTGSLAEVAPSQTGLVLSVLFPAEGAVGAASVNGTVTMTNTGTQELVGYTGAAPTLTLSQDGVVIWHSNGPMIQLAREIDLAPGESADYPASFTPVVCDIVDDMNEGFRDDLPAAPAGEYQLSAAIDFSGNGDAELVTGESANITLN